MATKDGGSNVRPKKNLGIFVCCVWIGAFAQSHNPANDTEDRCSCFCQQVFDSHLKSRSQKKVSERDKVGKTNIKPTVNSIPIPIFLFAFIFKFQRAFRGTNKIKTSLNVLKTPSVLSTLAILIQVPSIDLFHILALGVHSQILTMIVVM